MKSEDFYEVAKYINENSFIDKTMVTIYNDISKQQDARLVNGILQVSMKLGYDFNEEKIKNWLNFCNKMENVDKTDLIDLAVENKFYQFVSKIYRLEEENRDLKYRLKDWED